MTCSPRCLLCCPGGRSRCLVRRIRCLARLGHRDFTPRPCACLRDRPLRPAIARVPGSEVFEHVLGAICRPGGEQSVLCILKCAAAPHSYETEVSPPGISCFLIQFAFTLVPFESFLVFFTLYLSPGRSSLNRLISYLVSPRTARSARMRPISGANLNPCPEHGEATTTCGNSG
jgi:hypothetical protein